MDTTRQQKISRLVQKELSEIFRRETAKTRGTLVTVSSVRVSPDLSVANVRLSIFPSENAQAIIDNITRNERGIRHELAQQTRYQLRRCPELPVTSVASATNWPSRRAINCAAALSSSSTSTTRSTTSITSTNSLLKTSPRVRREK